MPPPGPPLVQDDYEEAEEMGAEEEDDDAYLDGGWGCGWGWGAANGAGALQPCTAALHSTAAHTAHRAGAGGCAMRAPSSG